MITSGLKDSTGDSLRLLLSSLGKVRVEMGSRKYEVGNGKWEIGKYFLPFKT
jgi:hypothetical protein